MKETPRRQRGDQIRHKGDIKGPWRYEGDIDETLQGHEEDRKERQRRHKEDLKETWGRH